MRPKLVTFGNVLLDSTYNIQRNPNILSKYSFDPNGLGECSSATLSNVAKDANETCEFLSSHTGGSALNTSKILSLLGETEFVFCGAIGNDANGAVVKQFLNKVGLRACLQVFENHPTGTCMCLINKGNRSCYANIGASIYFEQEFFQGQDLIETSHKQIFYIEGFFITGDRFSLCEYIVDVCNPSNGLKTFSTNLSAKYLIENHNDQMKYLAESATILFGNRDEFAKLAVSYQLNDPKDVIAHLINSTERNEKIIVCTHGAESVLYSQRSKRIVNEEFRFDSVPKEKIIDTTGCGDAFVAGFFYAFLRNKSVVDCVANGVDVAVKKITQIGATFQP